MVTKVLSNESDIWFVPNFRLRACSTDCLVANLQDKIALFERHLCQCFLNLRLQRCIAWNSGLHIRLCPARQCSQTISMRVVSLFFMVYLSIYLQ